MDIEQLQRKLIAAARQGIPADTVPLAFEKRVLALTGALPKIDRWAEWSAALWRAAAPCAGIAAVLMAWAAWDYSNPVSPPDLSQDLENAVLAAVQPDAAASADVAR